MAGPTLAATPYNVNSSSASTAALTSPSFTPAVGEVIVVNSVTEDSGKTYSGPPTSSAGGLTFTQRVADTTSSHCGVYIWTAVVGTGQNVAMTISTGTLSTTGQHSMVVERWTGAQLAATPATANTRGSGTPSATVTTAAASSIVSWVDGDWNAVKATPAYRSGATQDGIHQVNNIYCAYYAYQQAPTAGAQTFGMTAPTGQAWTLAGIEIQAASGGTTSVTSSRATTWAVAAQVNSTRATTWAVLARATSSRATTWTAAASVSASRLTTWAVLSRLTASRASSWTVLANVTASRSTTWNVAGSLTSVTSTRATTWNTAQTVAATRATSWQTRATVTTPRATTWSALASTTATRSTTWNVNATGQVSSTRGTTWNVKSQVASAKATTWDTRAAVATSRPTTWTTLAAVTRERATTWQMLATVSDTRSTTWNVSSELVIIPPADRTTLVRAESRVTRVAAESRVTTVPAERRVTEIR